MTAEERLALVQVKVERAKKHLGELKTARDCFLQSKPPPYIINRKPGGGMVSNQTSFPILNSNRIDESSFGRKVNGMSVAAKDKIRSIEPYKNGKGHNLWILHKLDIADKHHKILTTLIRVGDIRINLPGRFALGGPASFVDLPLPAFAAPGFGEALEVGKPFFTCERGTENNTEISFDVAISAPEVSEPKPIMWAATYLIESVDRLVQDFKPLLA